MASPSVATGGHSPANPLALGAANAVAIRCQRPPHGRNTEQEQAENDKAQLRHAWTSTMQNVLKHKRSQLKLARRI